MESDKHVCICYFSGTGNSKRVANWIAETAEQNNFTVSIYDISKSHASDVFPRRQEELIFLVSPVHGFNYPKIMLDFIRKIPPGRNNVVLMNTRAGMKLGKYITPGLSGITFMLASVVLKNKGYKIQGQIPLDMPSNWISVHPALRGKAVDYIVGRIHKRVVRHTLKLLSGGKDFIALRDIIQDILIAPVALGYYFIGRFVFAKSFYATYLCDECGVCVKNCPVRAIEMKKNHPFWTFKCESCMKCMNSCPKNAIETAHGLFLVSYILTTLALSFLVYPVSSALTGNEIISWTVSNLMFLLMLGLLYRVEHFLLRIAVIRKILRFLSLTHFRFWGRYRLKTKQFSAKIQTDFRDEEFRVSSDF